MATGLGVACTAIVTGPAAALAGDANAGTVPSVAASITGGRSALDHRALMKRVITSPFRAAITVAPPNMWSTRRVIATTAGSVGGAVSLEPPEFFDRLGVDAQRAGPVDRLPRLVRHIRLKRTSGVAGNRVVGSSKHRRATKPASPTPPRARLRPYFRVSSPGLVAQDAIVSPCRTRANTSVM